MNAFYDTAAFARCPHLFALQLGRVAAEAATVVVVVAVAVAMALAAY